MALHKKRNGRIKKIETGIQGLDIISEGGIPEGRTTMVSGTAGSAKTIFAVQFLAEGILKNGESGVFITFEETPQDIRDNMIDFGWNIEEWEKENRWVFVNAAPQWKDKTTVVGQYDLAGLLTRIEYAVKKSNARRVSFDSLGAIFNQFSETAIIRHEILRLTSALKELKTTTLLTAERTEDFGGLTRYGVEEFVTDNVIILRNVLEEEKRRRTIEILKFRGTPHQKGEFPFTVISDQGIVVIPLSAIELKQTSSNIRVSSGNKKLDKMCGGGFYRDSIILISGATGCGKTLMTTEFIEGGVINEEKCLLFAFEESREQLFRNAMGWGHDFEKLEREGKLKVICEYPEVANLEDHLISIKEDIEEFKPNRVAVDSLSALERVSTLKSFREFVIGLTSFIKHQEIVGLFTATTTSLMGGSSITEAHISTITDSIILLRYVEMFGEMHRGVIVLKMRGSMHDKEIREFTIDGTGMHIGRPFTNVTGIVSGEVHHIMPDEKERMKTLFEEES